MHKEGNAPDAVETQQLVSPSGVNVVLNGGKSEMDSATIPVQWFFSEDIAKTNPTHVLVIEQDEREAQDGERERWAGRRYLVRIQDGVKFIELRKSGYHRLMLLVLNGEISLNTRLNFLSSSNWGAYEWSMSITWSEQDLPYPFIGAKIVEFTVPEGLFAREPETWSSWFVWRWANAFFRHDPVNQCDYRRRKMLLPLTTLAIAGILLWKGLWWTVSHIAGVLLAIIIVLGDGVLLFFGFRPKNPIREEVQNAVALRWSWLNDTFTTRFSYRVWYERSHWDESREERQVVRKMPVTGIEIVGVIVCALMAVVLGAVAWILLTQIPWWKILLSIVGALVMSGVVIAITFLMLLRVPVAARSFSVQKEKLDRWGEKRAKERQQREKEAQAERDRITEELRMRHQRWLAENFGIEGIPERVDLKRIPRPETRGARAVQRFRVGFWALKAKVCRPYAK